MDNIVTVAEISVAVMQFSVAAALAGAVAFSAWRAKHWSKQFQEIEAFRRRRDVALDLSHQSFAGGGTLQLNSYCEQAE